MTHHSLPLTLADKLENRLAHCPIFVYNLLFPLAFEELPFPLQPFSRLALTMQRIDYCSPMITAFL